MITCPECNGKLELSSGSINFVVCHKCAYGWQAQDLIEEEGYSSDDVQKLFNKLREEMK